jgi:RNA polymerase sigma-70 factor (ECF subfamily)
MYNLGTEHSIPNRQEILAALRERIVAFAASRLSRDLAEDLAQEVLLVLHEKYAHVDKIEELLPLSLRIVRFKIMSAKQKYVRRGEYTQVSVDDLPLADPAGNQELDLERREQLSRLKAALAQISGRCREIFRLKLEGKSFPEIQRVLGAASINTIYTWDLRCRKRMLQLMGGSWEARK